MNGQLYENISASQPDLNRCYRQMWRVSWRINGHSGHGDPFSSKRQVDEWVSRMNKDFPGAHWAEPVFISRSD